MSQRRWDGVLDVFEPADRVVVSRISRPSDQACSEVPGLRAKSNNTWKQEPIKSKIAVASDLCSWREEIVIRKRECAIVQNVSRVRSYRQTYLELRSRGERNTPDCVRNSFHSFEFTYSVKKPDWNLRLSLLFIVPLPWLQFLPLGILNRILHLYSPFQEMHGGIQRTQSEFAELSNSAMCLSSNKNIPSFIKYSINCSQVVELSPRVGLRSSF